MKIAQLTATKEKYAKKTHVLSDYNIINIKQSRICIHDLQELLIIKNEDIF